VRSIDGRGVTLPECLCTTPVPTVGRRSVICRTCAGELEPAVALLFVARSFSSEFKKLRSEVEKLRTEMAGPDTQPSAEPGLYSLAQTAKRLGRSPDFLKDHRHEFRVVQLDRRLQFPVEFIEAIVRGDAEPEPCAKPKQTTPRRKRSRGDLLPIKEKR
jgi:hypothetical protein